MVVRDNLHVPPKKRKAAEMEDHAQNLGSADDDGGGGTGNESE